MVTDIERIDQLLCQIVRIVYLHNAEADEDDLPFKNEVLSMMLRFCEEMANDSTLLSRI